MPADRHSSSKTPYSARPSQSNSSGPWFTEEPSDKELGNESRGHILGIGAWEELDKWKPIRDDNDYATGPNSFHFVDNYPSSSGQGGSGRFQCSWEGCKNRTGFSSNYMLKEHQNAVHKARSQPFKCPGCDQEFKEKDHYASHVQTHSVQDTTSNPTKDESKESSTDGSGSIKTDGDPGEMNQINVLLAPPIEPGEGRRMHSQATTIDASHTTGNLKLSEFANADRTSVFGPLENSLAQDRGSDAVSSNGQNIAKNFDSRKDSPRNPPRNLDHILDPGSYYERLDMIELETAEVCGLLSGPITKEIPVLQCLEVIENTVKALQLLRSEGFCGNRVSILVQDPFRSNVAVLKNISIEKIASLSFSYGQFTEDSLFFLLCEIFGDFAVVRHLTDDWTGLNVLSKALSIGAISFSGSHICPFNLDIWALGEGDLSIGFGYSYRYRELACLKGFLNSPIWVLGKSESASNNERLKVSLTVQDVQELWGPIQFVGGTCTSAPLLRTHKGFIVPLPRNQQTDASLKEIECHWTEKVPCYVEAEDHIWLQSQTRVIIGTISNPHPLMKVNSRCNSKIHEIEEKISYDFQVPGTHRSYYTIEGYDVPLVVGYEGFSVGAVIKIRPQQEVTHKDRIIFECQRSDSDIEPLLKLQVGLEISACTGNARRVSLWEAIRLYHIGERGYDVLDCGHEIGSLECILSCWLGNKAHTACSDDDTSSSNGSLRALDVQKSFSHSCQENQPWGIHAFRRIIVASILDLKDTGIDHNGHLQACSPFARPTMNHRIDSIKANKWLGLLSDQEAMSTFAVLSSRCLIFDMNEFPKAWSPCPRSHKKPSQVICLSTRVLRRPSFLQQRRFSRRQFGLSSPPPDSDSDELSPGAAVRLNGRDFLVKKFWRENDNSNLLAHPCHSLEFFTKQWSGTLDFKEQLNPDIKGGEPIDLIIFPRISSPKKSG